jgi:phosphohistidine phosphatase
MQLYLLRHGIAEDGRVGTSDADRALTAEGRRKLRQVLTRAAKAGVKPDLIISSPLKRALQTAEIAKNVLGYGEAISRSNALTPGADPKESWSEIRAHSAADCLLLVGHNPLFSSLAGFLLGTAEAQIDFKKGALMRIDFEKISLQPRGVLRWYLTPRLAANET